MHQNQFSEYITNLLDRLCSDTSRDAFPVSINFESYPFRSCDVPLPRDSTGCVYMILSVKNHQTVYIGETQNLSKRLHDHNEGIGSQDTANILLCPWALFAYVTGFTSGRKDRRNFERHWKFLKQQLPYPARTPESSANLAMTAIQQRITKGEPDADLLRYVHTARMKYH